MYIYSYVLCTLVFPYYESSLIVFSWWVFRDTMKTPTAANYKSFHCTYVSLLSKCTSIHSSLHPCLPLLWIISDCLLMMSIRRHTQDNWLLLTSHSTVQKCCCLNVHPFILLCTLVFPYYESSLIVFSWWVFRDTGRPQPPNYKSFHCT